MSSRAGSSAELPKEAISRAERKGLSEKQARVLFQEQGPAPGPYSSLLHPLQELTALWSHDAAAGSDKSV